MKVVPFYTLPRSIQDRVTGSVKAQFAPYPIAVVLGGPRLELLWLLVAAVGLVAFLLLFFVGFGSMSSGLSQHGPIAFALHVLFLALPVFGGVMARRHLAEVKALPIARGIYLFPACVLDARSANLRVYPMLQAQITVTGSVGRVAFPGASFSFPLKSQEDAAELQSARSSMEKATGANDSAELSLLDPFHEPRFSSPVGPRNPLSLILPDWQRLGWAVALGTGLALGAGSYFFRNLASDALLFSRVRQADTQEAYRAYLRLGTAHKAEVQSKLLPRAALRDASVQGTVEAVEAFREAFPRTAIEPEIEAAMAAAMKAELSGARAKGTRAALQEFASRYPSHGLAPELAAALHELYARELARVTARVPDVHKKDVVPLLEQLFAVLEKSGPRVELRFRRRPSPKLVKADKAIIKTATWNGPASYVTHYFDPAHHKAREDAMRQLLLAGFSATFDPDLVTFVGGPEASEPDVGGPDDAFPKVTVPTLFVVHGADWSGHTYTSRTPRVTIVGLNFAFDGVFVLPQDKRAYRTKLAQFRSVSLTQLQEGGQVGIEERIYGTMTKEAYDAFAKKLLAPFAAP